MKKKETKTTVGTEGWTRSAGKCLPYLDIDMKRVRVYNYSFHRIYFSLSHRLWKVWIIRGCHLAQECHEFTWLLLWWWLRVDSSETWAAGPIPEVLACTLPVIVPTIMISCILLFCSQWLPEDSIVYVAHQWCVMSCPLRWGVHSTHVHRMHHFYI